MKYLLVCCLILSKFLLEALFLSCLSFLLFFLPLPVILLFFPSTLSHLLNLWVFTFHRLYVSISHFLASLYCKSLSRSPSFLLPALLLSFSPSIRCFISPVCCLFFFCLLLALLLSSACSPQSGGFPLPVRSLLSPCLLPVFLSLLLILLLADAYFLADSCLPLPCFCLLLTSLSLPSYTVSLVCS